MSKIIPPGSTIGILGGGQLGRMTGMAARAMGYDVHILDPDPMCAARAIATRTVTAPYDDDKAVVDFAEHVDLLTLEIEQVSTTTMNAAARFAPVHPSPDAVHIVQDRGRQKRWLKAHGFPLGAFRVATSAADLAEAIDDYGPCIAKAATGGYDGRGQIRLADAKGAAAAWKQLGARACVVEQILDIAAEVSVMTASGSRGKSCTFPVSLNHHDHGILTWSVQPAPIDAALARQAEQLGIAITEALGIVGLLAVELFVLRNGTLCVNELAPRPHNTFHQTERGATTSQFEQLVRAVCGLPLGSVNTITPAAIHNLLGDLWVNGAPDFTPALRVPGVRVHLYGKPDARPGRKMGHLSAIGATSDAARDAVLAAFRAIKPAAARKRAR